MKYSIVMLVRLLLLLLLLLLGTAVIIETTTVTVVANLLLLLLLVCGEQEANGWGEPIDRENRPSRQVSSAATITKIQLLLGSGAAIAMCAAIVVMGLG